MGQSLILQERDRNILDLLRDQGFATFGQVCTRYFPNVKICSKRLRLLEEHKYITSYKIGDYFTSQRSKGFFPHMLGLGIRSQTQIYQLSRSYRKLVSETNRLLKPDLVLHQLILNDVRFFLEDSISDCRFMLNDPQIKTLSNFSSGRRKEFTPDISIENSDYIIAVELERTVKSLNRYSSRFWFYKDSIYSHVLYYYVNETHLKMIMKQAGQSRKIGFAHYLRPNQVLTVAWGYLTLSEWIAKVQSIKAKG